MKRLTKIRTVFAAALTASVFCGMLGLAACGEGDPEWDEPATGGLIYKTYSQDGETWCDVSFPEALSGKITVPSSYWGIPVRHVQPLTNYREITEVVLPASLERIPESMFYGCDSLQKITVPFLGVVDDEELEENADGYAYSLSWLFTKEIDYGNRQETKTVFPESLKTVIVTGDSYVGSTALLNLEQSHIDTVYFDTPKSGTAKVSFNLCEDVYLYCDSVTDLTYPAVLFEYDCEFSGQAVPYNSLRYVDNVVNYGEENAFLYAETAEQVVLLDYRGEGARITPDGQMHGKPVRLMPHLFCHNETVTAIDLSQIDDPLTEYCYFNCCTNMQQLTLPQTTQFTVIQAPFTGLANLQELHLNECNGLTFDMFESFTRLNTITLSPDVTEYTVQAGNLICDGDLWATVNGNIPANVVSIQRCALVNREIARIHIPDTVQRTACNFNLLQNITEVSSGTRNWSGSFSHLTDVTFTTVTEFVTEGDFTYYADGEYAFITAFAGDPTLEREIAIPQTLGGKTVVSIGNALVNNAMTALTLPDTLLQLGSLKGCSNLKELFIPDGVRILNGQMLQGCSSLQSLSLPHGNITLNSTVGYLFGKTEFAGASAVQCLIVEQWEDTYTCYVPDSLKSVTFRGGRIDKILLSGLRLDSVHFGADVSYIHLNFDGAMQKKPSITVDANNAFYCVNANGNLQGK